MIDNRFSRISRRNLLKGVSFISGFALSHSPKLNALAKSELELQYEAYPFTLGVASGEPESNSVVIWTRLAAQSLSKKLAQSIVPVQWFVAEDEQMSNIIAQGEGLASPEFGHSLHIVVENLQPDRFYWYRFQTQKHLSPKGRTRTTPVGSANKLSFAFVSCQNYEHGYYNAYRYLAKEKLDFVIHLGDYIYEGGNNKKSTKKSPRSHDSPEPTDIEGYRQRYSLYRSDPDLQEAHRLFPFICTWDDHEVENNYANLKSAKNDNVELFRKRRAAAYQAYYEFLPLRPYSRPQAENMQLYRHLEWGDLARFYVLDTRQYRNDQPCDHNGKGGMQIIANCQERFDRKRSLLGKTQEQWLHDSLSSSSSHWNVIAQPYLFSQLKISFTDDEPLFLSDAWDGYPISRQKILDLIEQKRPSNPVFIGGDIHSFWINQVYRDFDDRNSEVLATEFVGTSITSNNRVHHNFLAALLPLNPHVQFFESRFRGYVKCDLSPSVWQAQLKVVDTVKQTKSKLSTLATFQVKNGSTKIERI